MAKEKGEKKQMSNKNLFEEFINKLHLNGEIEEAMIDIHEDTISSNVFIQHKMFGVEIEFAGNFFDRQNIEVPIVNIETLYKLLKSFPEDAEVKLSGRGTNVNDDRLHKISLTTDILDSQFILGKPKAIDNKIKVDTSKISDWLFEFNFTEFNELYRKYQNIFKDYETFYFSNKRGKVFLNFGGIRKTTENSITVELDIELSKRAQEMFKKSLLFNKDRFNAVLNSNREADIQVFVNNSMYMIECKDRDIVCRYFNTTTKNQ